MKQENYVRKDGSTGVTNIPEAGDKYKAKYNTVRSVKTGDYENHSLGVVTADGKEIYLKITQGQKKSLEKAGDLTGRTIEFYQYSLTYTDDKTGTEQTGSFVGVKAL